MAEHRWGAMNILMRLKHKIREKFFWDRIIVDPDPPDTSMQSSVTSGHESGTTQLPTHPHVQFYDAMDGSEPQYHQTFTQMMLQGGESSMLEHPQQGINRPEAFLTLADFDMDEEQLQEPWPPRDVYYGATMAGPDYAESGWKEEYVDSRMELPEDQNNSASTSQLGRVETAEMMDTGESSASAAAVALQPSQWQQIMRLRQYLEIDDGVERAGAGWRVVLNIVSAFRRISGLVRVRRLQRITSGQSAVSTPRRVGQGTRYKGIRQRNGKWVSEIRIGGTPEKVWLGSFNTAKEAALAFDAGKHHCGTRRSSTFNFADSPRLLGNPESLSHLSSVERRTRIQRLAEDHARAYGGRADIR